MRSFSVINLKQIYINGELEDFCNVIGYDLKCFENAKGDEEYILTDFEIEKLKELGIFEEWV